MAESIVIDQFEGPLGLLLELIERNQMSVTDIAVATITSQYLARMSSLTGLDATSLSEFLSLGSRLVYIKSLALLPTAEPGEQAMELQRLGEELAEYRRYQSAARTLGRHAQSPSWSRPIAASLDAASLPLPNVSTSDLAAAFQAALARLKPARARGSIAAELSQAEIASSLKKRLRTGAFELGTLLGQLRNRLEVVVTFSALLEIIRDGHGRVTQTAQFGPIMVEPAGE